MGNDKISNLLVPNLSHLNGKTKALQGKLDENVKLDEFKNLLSKEVKNKDKSGTEEIKLSVHAAKRMQERNIEIDSQEFLKLNEALEKLKNKGGKDSLVITNKAAYIIDVNNSTVVTALEKDNMAENVITKIDSTMIIN
ncbi:MAG: flagellar protein [Halobacteriovoraceae bacterium]|nr:flagellar protein [Halobacteriovoraceae bacterium]